MMISSRFWFAMIMCIFAHVIDDYFLQSACLCDLKQKSWWEKKLLRATEMEKQMYRHDYLAALLCHAMSWSAAIMLPLVIMERMDNGTTAYGFYCVAFVLNTLSHASTDNAKANWKIINLIEDQCTHLAQIFLTALFWYSVTSR